MKRTIVVLLQFAALSASAASAGTLEVSVPTHTTPYPSAPPSPTAVSAPLDPKPIVAGQWTISLADPDAVLVPLQVSVTPQSGWIGSSMTFDVPYFAAKSGRIVLAAPVINDDVNGSAVQSFLDDASATTSVDDLMLLNQRARRLWDARRQTIDAMAVGKSDAKVIFWLLQTEATLVAQTHLQLDASAHSAMLWMGSEVQKRPQSRVFSAGGVNINDAKGVLAQLSARDSQLYSMVVNHLSRDVGSPDEAVQTDGCRRAKSLTSFFDSIHDGTTPKYDGWEQHEVIILKNVAICDTHSNLKKLQAGEALSADDQINTATTSSRLHEITKQLSESGGSTAVVHEALGRAADLEATIPP